MTTASFRLPLKALEYKGAEGKCARFFPSALGLTRAFSRFVAERILEAYYFAEDDPFRAATNNKGNVLACARDLISQRLRGQAS